MNGTENSYKILLKAEHLTEIERWKEAIPLLLQFLAQNPQHHRANCLLSLCYYHLGELKKALEFAEKAIAAEPEEEWGHRLRSIVLSKLGKKKESLKSAEEAVRMAPDQAFSLQTLAVSYLELNQTRKAKQIAEKMRENFPESDAAYFVLGNIHLQSGNPYEAENCFREALRFNPNNSLARNNLGVAILDQERQKPMVNRDKGISLFGDSTHNEIAEHFTEALKLEPNNPYVIENIKYQFSYSPFTFLIISLLPFLFFFFLVMPAGAILLGLIGLISLLNLSWDTFKRRRSATPELKMFLKTTSKNSISENFAVFKRIFHDIVWRNWLPHLLGLLAVILKFVAKEYPVESSTGYSLTYLSVIMIVVSGVWLAIRIKKG
jgi:tetratricopeptide (TPR) repeat protein